MKISTLLLALATLIAFAANSILCRLALMSENIGALEFTAFRLASGIIILLPLILLHKNKHVYDAASKNVDPLKIRFSNFYQAAALFGYALFFSLAYIQLEAGTGALILFASVQITMIGVSLVRGNKVTLPEWTGVIISFSGLIYLLSPGFSAPPVLGTAFMIASGVSWGIYSLLGKDQPQPILSTARNFLFCLPGVVVLALIIFGKSMQTGHVKMNADGIILAVSSGALASGLGYVLWYLTVQKITTVSASVIQLAVPVLVAIGGVLLLDESLTLRLALASILIIGGIIIAICGRNAPEPLNRQH
ncbi:MAG: EamA family transporter [candidate division Zixibacteria bacterium]|nr:EamA family transporter [candidate division Zixibacteria bacterium]